MSQAGSRAVTAFRKIALIGAGRMGRPMAVNLHKAGLKIEVVDPSEEALAALRALGIACTDRFESATDGADLVILMLADPKIIADAVERLTQQKSRPRIIVDCSSTDVVLTRDLAAKAAASGIAFLDAPVSGSTEGAAAATLSFMVGGDAEALSLVRPVFDALGKKVVHFGPVGSGQLAKTCNNMIVAIEYIGICEAFAIVEANGLDPKLFRELCLNATARSWAMEYRCPVPGVTPDSPSSHGYEGGGSGYVVAKDLGIALSAAKSVGMAPELAQIARRAYQSAVEKGLGNLDFSAIYTLMRPDVRPSAAEVKATGSAQ